jgi:hypothetical protein
MKIFIFFIFIYSSLFADITFEGISANEGIDKYKTNTFNQKINISPGCHSIKEVMLLIEENTGMTIINNTNLDYSRANCGVFTFKYVGDVLNSLIGDNQIVFYKQGYDKIILEYARTYSETFPSNWNMERTISKLKQKLSDLNIIYYGRVIEISGQKNAVKNGKKIINNLRDWAIREIPLTVSIVKLNTNKTGIAIISNIRKQKYDKNIKIKIKHSTIVPLPYQLGNLVFDLQLNRVYLNDKEYINLNNIGNRSFFIDNYQVSIRTGFGFVQ